MIDQKSLDLNTFELREVRLSCIHFLPMLGLLRSRNPADTACKFLLDDVKFTNQYTNASNGAAPFELPWRDGYAKLFWRRYVPSQTPDDWWRALTPVEYDLSPVFASLQLTDGEVHARAYLYPWGIGLLIDVTFKSAKPIAAGVDRLVDLHNRANIAWKSGADSGTAGPGGLVAEIRDRLMPLVYGKDIAPELLGEQFSIATVVDAADIVVTDPIPEAGPLHHVLEALTGWKPKWKLIQPEAKSLETCSIPSASAPEGHVLYGKSRSRAIWFPANFRAVADYPDTLACYHQNLSMATLHAEALCTLAQDAAAQLTAKGSLADLSVTYRNCARLAAGLLGRLHGRKSDTSTTSKPLTYRSGSVRAQILAHKDEINQIRTALLAGGTPLDA